MGLLSWLRARARRRPPAAPPPEVDGVAILRVLELDEDLVAWAEQHPADLGTLWTTCPRGDWLLAIVARAHLPLARLQRLAVAMDLEFSSDGAHDENAILEELGRGLEQALNGDEILRERQRSENKLDRWTHSKYGSSDRAWTTWANSHDATERALDQVHRRFADRLRRALPYADLRAALYPSAPTSPYR